MSQTTTTSMARSRANLRRFVALLVVPAAGALIALVPACSSSSSPDPAASDAGDDSGGPNPFTDPDAGANGKSIDRSAACARFVAAQLAKSDALHCTLTTVPKCPDSLETFEKTQFPGVCVTGYDEGAISNCEKRTATYKTCADFGDRAKACELAVYIDKTGVACGTDAGGDSSIDAPADAPSGETASSDAADGGSGG